ncbi:antitoxin [Agrococcus beijingensis]|uniref:antitoxin n=1 Tax=Agrococcus beijingensis TaxID=3068634 RepID=UPI0027420757|nr:antitoxin [Agrococcus sp. REN33]
MGFEDLVNQGKEALHSEQGEQKSDQAITGAGDAFDKLTGGRFAEHTDGLQERADGFIGRDDQQAQQEQAQEEEEQQQQ